MDQRIDRKGKEHGEQKFRQHHQGEEGTEKQAVPDQKQKNVAEKTVAKVRDPDEKQRERESVHVEKALERAADVSDEGKHERTEPDERAKEDVTQKPREEPDDNALLLPQEKSEGGSLDDHEVRGNARDVRKDRGLEDVAEGHGEKDDQNVNQFLHHGVLPLVSSVTSCLSVVTTRTVPRCEKSTAGVMVPDLVRLLGSFWIVLT